MTIATPLIHAIKAKKPLQNLDDAFILTRVQAYFKHHPRIHKKLLTHDAKTLTKARDFKNTVKALRNDLNRTYGVFWIGTKLDLAHHQSTKERVALYPHLYDDIFAITGVPESIVDLAAGLNPLSHPSMHGFHGKYIATELTAHDCVQLRTLCAAQNLPIDVQQCNIFTDPIPPAEMCFMFKILDTLAKNHKEAEALIQKTPARYLIASFATTTLNGRPMRHPHRGWLERMLQRLGYTYKILSYANEIFYVIKK